MTGLNSVTQEAIFIGANRQGFVADSIPNLVAFGAGINVALWNPLAKDKKGVYHTLTHHTKEVTCIRFLPSTNTLISTGEDGRINLWQQKTEGGQINFDLLQSIDQEDCAITALAVSEGNIFVTGNSLGDIHIWGENNGEYEALHTFKVKHNFLPTTFALQKIGDLHLLVVGGTSNQIFVYSFDSKLQELTQCAALSGHEDWIKCLSFVTEKEGLDYILASGSQDRYIRLWRLRLNEAIDDSDEDELKLVLLSNKQYKFAFGPGRAAFSSEALIMGHDDWVTGLQWRPTYTKSTAPEKLQLLSLSADTALMIWEMDEESGVWVSVSRLGELSIKGASTATGASGGFWSCLWFVDAATNTQYILANGKTGSIRVYQKAEGDEASWEASLGMTGPIREVNDLVWSEDGSYFSVTSLDQTTRLIGPWNSNRLPGDEHNVSWHEFARPQIHGYDMICLDKLSATKFVSGGDEKVLRVFEMTQSINKLVHKFCGVDIASGDQAALPEAASLPVLGLSNKAANEQLEAGEAQQREEDYEGNNETESEKTDILDTLQGPPLEDFLQRHTLFPEIEKLYGHGYEITCCATSPNNTLIASACRSNSAKHAVIRIFNAKKDYQLVSEVLKGHNLTITSLAFSPKGNYLVAVSRDRQLSLWKVRNEEEGTFDLIELNPKAHTRIIWDCSWSPAYEGVDYFITGSRDKSIKLWKATDSACELICAIKTEDAVTSISCLDKLLSNHAVIAAGHESGQISLYVVNMAAKAREIVKVLTLNKEILPADKIKKLAFSTKYENGQLLLAAGSSDHSVRLYSIGKDAII